MPSRESGSWPGTGAMANTMPILSSGWSSPSFCLQPGSGADRRRLRHAALAVLLIAVLKVFISDMAGLEGLYRVASFLGLGLSLVAIGWIYQRFVYPARSGTGPRLRPCLDRPLLL